MLLTKHKLLLLGIGWSVLALLALAGMVAYAGLSQPEAALPGTVAVLALIPAPTFAPRQLASRLGASDTQSAAPASPTASQASATPTPSTTPSPTQTATDTPTPVVASLTRTRPPTAAATGPGAPTSPPATATSVPATGVPAATATNTPVTPPTIAPTATKLAATPTNTSVSPTNPPPPAPAPLADFWGINGGPLDGNNSANPFDGQLSNNPALRAKSLYWMNQAGIRWFRNYGSDGIIFSWRFVEPSPGVYDWTAWDILVREAQKRDVNLLASIGNSVPAWANGSSDWRAQPLDLYTNPMQSTAWYQFVNHVVERYDGDGVNNMPGLTRPVKFWELWNEPDLREGGNAPNYPAHQFNGGVKDYVRLTQVGYAAVKAADPASQVVGPATAQFVGNLNRGHSYLWNWTDWVQAGGLNTVDIVSFHAYFDRSNWDVTGQVDGLLDKLDASRGGKPVWVTEIGWAGGTTSDFQDEDRNFVRSVVIFWQRPAIERYFWYTLQESETYAGSFQMAFLQTLTGSLAKGAEPDPLFHPIFRVSEVMARVLAGFGSGSHPAAVGVGAAARAYHFSRQGQDVWVAWQRAPDGVTTITLDTGGRKVRVIGLEGEDLGTFTGGALTVGPSPVYLTTQLDWNPNLGSIAGRVSHASQAGQWTNGLDGATVDLAGPVNATATTDSDGNYLFEGLPDGAYVVTVAGSASPARQAVTVSSTGAWGRTSFIVSP